MIAVLVACEQPRTLKPLSQATFAGRVVSADGRGLRAHLTITNHASGEVVIDADTDGNGAFSFDLSAAKISVAVTAPDGYAYVESIDLPEIDRSIELSTDCERAEIRFVDAGSELPPSQVRLARISELTGDQFRYRIGGDGRWQGCLPPARYIVRDDDLAIPTGSGDLVVPGPPLVVRVMSETAARQPPPASEPTMSTKSLMEDLPSTNRVLGIAESNHGTAEFAMFRADLAESLADRGYTWILIEAAFGDALAIDDYVTGGATTLDDAVYATGYFAWMTLEQRDMLERLRRLNEGRRSKIRFAGFDIAYNETAIALVLGSTEMLDEATKALLQDLRGDHGEKWLALDESSRRRVLDGLARFTVNPDRGVDGNREALAARMLEWHFELATVSNLREAAGLRDRAMAAMVTAMRACEPHAKLQLWAHLEHLAHRYPPGRASMGEHLTRELGSDYYVVALLTRGGTATARDPESEKLTALEMPPSPPYALESGIGGELGANESAYVALDALKGALGEWVSGVRYVRFFGWMLPENPWTPIDARASIDAAVVFGSTTATRLMPIVKRKR